MEIYILLFVPLAAAILVLPLDEYSDNSRNNNTNLTYPPTNRSEIKAETQAETASDRLFENSEYQYRISDNPHHGTPRSHYQHHHFHYPPYEVHYYHGLEPPTRSCYVPCDVCSVTSHVEFPLHLPSSTYHSPRVFWRSKPPHDLPES